MNVPAWVWTVTIIGLLALLTVDLLVIGRKPRQITMRAAAMWVVFYALCAALFGVGVWALRGGQYAGEFFAGYVTEYSLSIDNLFVFLVILSTFGVPLVRQYRVLLIGIVLALVLRGLFILVGAVLIARFSWVFYLFGGFLLLVAGQLARSGENDGGGLRIKGLRRVLGKLLPAEPASLSVNPASPPGDGGNSPEGSARSCSDAGSRRAARAPMFLAVIALGVADVLFALDSIPAIFGLTKEPFLVFAANAFALMGLRQLYVLIGTALNRLAYLGFGLAVVLGFIGVKLILQALHENSLPFVYGGKPLPVPTIGTGTSLVVIMGILLVTVIASLLRARARDYHHADGSEDVASATYEQTK